jgi:hypothetical protein
MIFHRKEKHSYKHTSSCRNGSPDLTVTVHAQNIGDGAGFSLKNDLFLIEYINR